MAKRITRNLRRPPTLAALLSDDVRKASIDGRTLYSVADVLRLVSDRPRELWDQLRHRDPSLEALTEPAHFDSPNLTPHDDEALLAAPLEALFRILQSVPGTRAEALKRWLAATAAESLDEADDPELAVQRIRQEYEAQGYPRNWIDQRLRAISARAEVVSEWYKRGAQSSDDFRTLTNTLMLEAFGMDVETYRQHKGLFGRENLRDHMSDLELALTSLAETIAANLHRSHGSKSLPELEADMQSAGSIAANTRTQIESATGRPLIEAEPQTHGFHAMGERGKSSSPSQTTPPAPSKRQDQSPPNPSESPSAPEPTREVLFRRPSTSEPK